MTNTKPHLNKSVTIKFKELEISSDYVPPIFRWVLHKSMQRFPEIPNGADMFKNIMEQCIDNNNESKNDMSTCSLIDEYLIKKNISDEKVKLKLLHFIIEIIVNLKIENVEDFLSSFIIPDELLNKLETNIINVDLYAYIDNYINQFKTTPDTSEVFLTFDENIEWLKNNNSLQHKRFYIKIYEKDYEVFVIDMMKNLVMEQLFDTNGIDDSILDRYRKLDWDEIWENRILPNENSLDDDWFLKDLASEIINIYMYNEE